MSKPTESILHTPPVMLSHRNNIPSRRMDMQSVHFGQYAPLCAYLLSRTHLMQYVHTFSVAHESTCSHRYMGCLVSVPSPFGTDLPEGRFRHIKAQLLTTATLRAGAFGCFLVRRPFDYRATILCARPCCSSTLRPLRLSRWITPRPYSAESLANFLGSPQYRARLRLRTF